MWVFGYGSLMWDGWQSEFDCREVVTAELRGYARTFNKKSVSRWGTRAAPGPTLNLVVAPGSTCTGIAFRFDDERSDTIRAKLIEREGKNFALETLGVSAGVSSFDALVPVYRGRNVFDTTDPAVLASLAMTAQGEGGSCQAYIDGAYRHLQLLGIEDAAVTAMWKAMQKLIAQKG